MNNFLILPQNKALPLVGPMSFSTGDGLDLTNRYGYDNSRRSQGLTHRKRTTALTASVQIAFNPYMCMDAGISSIFDYIDDIQNAVGELVDLYWQGRKMGSFVVVSAQFSASIDAAQVFPSMSVSMAFNEGFVRRETLQRAVGVLEKPVK